MESIWSMTTQIPRRESLKGTIHKKAVVIGGGMAGILTAYLLQEGGIETVVLEADAIASGQTGNTTAKITSQHNLIYAYLIEKFGEEKAAQYAHANQESIEQYQTIIEKEQIDCQFQRCPSYLYTTEESKAVELENEAQAAKLLGIPSEFTTETELPFPVAGAVKFHNQAQFHPLKFIKEISEKLEIYENTKVTGVEENCVYTEQGMVEAEHVIFTVHYPWQITPGYYFLRMHQERSYALALKLSKEAQTGRLPEKSQALSTTKGRNRMEGMYLGVDEDGYSFRTCDCKNKTEDSGQGQEESLQVLILGGGSHRTGENTQGGRYEMLRRKALEWYPGCTEIAHWSAQDCMPLDKIPYIGYFSSDIPNWYVATGFQKWGMTTSMAAARIITDMIAGQENEDEEVFAPRRFPVTALSKNFTQNAVQAVKGLSKQVLTTEEFPSKCPHLGCKLERNRDEDTWECPCHGSRFGCEGRLLDGPAQVGLKN